MQSLDPLVDHHEQPQAQSSNIIPRPTTDANTNVDANAGATNEPIGDGTSDAGACPPPTSSRAVSIPTPTASMTSSKACPPVFKTVNTAHNIKAFSAIIMGNCLCSCFIALTFWGFAKQDDLQRWEKRSFNSLTLLFSAALGFGIGLLCDRVGLLARGLLLETRANSIDDIGYIIKGSLSTYATLVAQYIRYFFSGSRPRANLGPTFWTVFLYVILSICGRFGVAFLGFAYNLDDNPVLQPKLYRSDWANITIPCGIQAVGNRERDGLYLDDVEVFNDVTSATLDAISAYSRSTRAPRELQIFQADYPSNESYYDSVLNLSRFASLRNNIQIEVVNEHESGRGGRVLGTYKIQDLQDARGQFSEWQASIDVACTRYNFSIDRDTQIDHYHDPRRQWNLSTLTEYIEHDGRKVSVRELNTPRSQPSWESGIRWGSPWVVPKTTTPSYLTTHALDTWILAVTSEKLFVQQLPHGTEDPRTIEISRKDFLANTPFVFRCTHKLREVANNHTKPTFMDIIDTVSTETGSSTRRRILAPKLYHYLRLGPLSDPKMKTEIWDLDQVHLPLSRPQELNESNLDQYMASLYTIDHSRNHVFYYGIGRRNTRDSEIWLATYIANNIGMRLGFLNEILRRIEIEPAKLTSMTVLEIHWKRVAGILGGLFVFQLIFSLVALFCSRGRLALQDDVAEFTHMFQGFPAGDHMRQSKVNDEDMNHEGSFESENGGYRWVFVRDEFDDDGKQS